MPKRKKATKPKASAATSLPPGERVTIVQAKSPPIVAKRFFVGSDGKIDKKSVANVFVGLAWSKPANDAESFAAILRACADRSDCCLVPGKFLGDDIDGKPFTLVTEAALAAKLKKQPADASLAGVHAVGSERWAARLKRSIAPGAWLLLDADDPEGMPEEMRLLDIHQRLALFDRLLPGVLAAERILSRSSSFRVRRADAPPRRHGHAWVRVSDPSRIERLRTCLAVASVNEGLAFRSPRRSRATGEIMGHEWRTMFDLSVLVPGRLVFGAKPLLDDSAVAAGYVIDDAGIEIENAGGGFVDIAGFDLPSAAAMANYNRTTGTHTTITQHPGSASLGIHVRGVLKPETPIERRGIEKPLAEWIETLAPGVKLRCEAPFRASSSEAAFIVLSNDGSVRAFDIGTGEKYSWPGPHRHEEGEPGERVVIGTNRTAMIEAAMLLHKRVRSSK